MNNHITNYSVKWVKIRSWIVGLTAVLVVVPSLFNAGIDIYELLFNVPRTQSEQTNAELFVKYFNKTPIVAVPVPIKTMLGTVNMKLSIYEAGDIFAEYGNYSHWFPFPSQKTSSLSLVSSAYAQSLSSSDKADEYTQVDKLKGNKIERERFYSDGTKEKYIINLNTGEIHNKTVIHDTPTPSGLSGSPSIIIIEFPTIDIEALKEVGEAPNQ